jgi:hypothetical protein
MNIPKTKCSRVIPKGSQWRKKLFFNQFQFKDKRSALRRYSNMLNKYLIDEEEYTAFDMDHYILYNLTVEHTFCSFLSTSDDKQSH